MSSGQPSATASWASISSLRTGRGESSIGHLAALVLQILPLFLFTFQIFRCTPSNLPSKFDALPTLLNPPAHLSSINLTHMSCHSEGLTESRSRRNWTLEDFFRTGCDKERIALLQINATTLRCSSSLRSPSLRKFRL